MRSPRDESLYLQDIGRAIAQIREFTQGGEQEFRGSELIQAAVIQKLQIIGEAAKRLSDATKAKVPGLPWRDIAGTRDWLTHGYFGIDLDVVWDVVANKLAQLQDAVGSLLDDENPKNTDENPEDTTE